MKNNKFSSLSKKDQARLNAIATDAGTTGVKLWKKIKDDQSFLTLWFGEDRRIIDRLAKSMRISTAQLFREWSAIKKTSKVHLSCLRLDQLNHIRKCKTCRKLIKMVTEND